MSDGTKAIAKFPKTNADAVAIERLRREAETLLAIDHENVIKPIDANVEGSEPWYVMPVGQELKKYWADLKPNLDARQIFDESWRIVHGLLEGLAALHARNWTHRDIKPANAILIDRIPKLIDLGVVHLPERDPLTIVDGRGVGNAFSGLPTYTRREWAPSDDCRAMSWLWAWLAAADPKESYGRYDWKFHEFVADPRTEAIRTMMAVCAHDETVPKNAAIMLSAATSDVARWSGGGSVAENDERRWIDDLVARQRESQDENRRREAERLGLVDTAIRVIAPFWGPIQQRLRETVEEMASRGIECEVHLPWWQPIDSAVRAALTDPTNIAPLFDFRFGGGTYHRFIINCELHWAGPQRGDGYDCLPLAFKVGYAHVYDPPPHDRSQLWRMSTAGDCIFSDGTKIERVDLENEIMAVIKNPANSSAAINAMGGERQRAQWTASGRRRRLDASSAPFRREHFKDMINHWYVELGERQL